MKYRELIYVLAIMAAAWPIMGLTLPVSGSMIDVITVALDHILGSGWWGQFPIVSLVPIGLVWLTYCVAIYGATFWILPTRRPQEVK